MDFKKLSSSPPRNNEQNVGDRECPKPHTLYTRLIGLCIKNAYKSVHLYKLNVHIFVREMHFYALNLWKYARKTSIIILVNR